MTPHPTRTANFDPVARPYRWMEYLTLGKSLERCRNRFLPALSTRRHALILGDGDGRFLARLLAENPAVQADAVDTSAAMLQLLERRAIAAGAESRLRTHHNDALTFTPAQSCDLIVTHFFLDCLTQPQLDSLALRLTQVSAPCALWLISDFRIPAGAMRLPARAIVRLLYLAFRLLTGLRTSALPDHQSALTTAGFHLVTRHLSLAGLLTSEVWEYTPAMLPPQKPKTPHPLDPVPDPEPASPSLPEPDPGVFHHEPDERTCTPVKSNAPGD
jgi:SAM-dependent methyltransferase